MTDVMSDKNWLMYMHVDQMESSPHWPGTRQGERNGLSEMATHTAEDPAQCCLS